MTQGLTAVLTDGGLSQRRLKLSRLVVLEGPDAGKELRIEREVVSVGRSLICDLTLDDNSVSGTHFEIQAHEKGFLLRDLDSTNGTFCGDVQIREIWLRHGQRVRVGQSVLRFDPLEGSVDLDASGRERFYGLVGRSLKMREIFALLERVASTDLTVLIRGETGTGKELVARALHQAGKRATGPMVVQDCSAIPKDLTESILFGHEKGSFTGATERRAGCFEQANAGTLFLDEVGELEIVLQPKLLRVLETRQVKRVGGTKEIPADVRVVAATNRDLRKMVSHGTFREDLYYRLGVVTIDLPPLRERTEDIPLLIESFLERIALQRFGDANHFEVRPEALERLCGYPWPGNVRVLRNTVERAGSLADGRMLELKDLTPMGPGASQLGMVPVKVPQGASPTPVAPSPAADAGRFVEQGVPFKDAKQEVLDAFEAEYLTKLLHKNEGNITRSAQEAGLTRYHLRELSRRHGIRNE